MAQITNMNLSGNWRFAMMPKEEATGFHDTVKLPGTMEENAKGHDNTTSTSTTYLKRDYIYSGKAVYQRDISIPKSWEKKHIMLYLERTRKIRVWIDDELIRNEQEKSISTPHQYDVTNHLQAGSTHTLTIEVDNSPQGMPEAMFTTFEKDYPWGHMVSDHTQTNWNGILGKMELRALPEVSIHSFRIRPDVESKTARVNLTINNPVMEEELYGTLELEAVSSNSKKAVHKPEKQVYQFRIAAGTSSSEIAVEYPMGDGVLLWDEFSPHLYSMKATLLSAVNGEPCTCVEEEFFGMRKFGILLKEDGGKQCTINGYPVHLRGEINCAVFPMTGYAPMDLASWLEIMKTYKEYGINHVRFHTWTPPKAAFQAADRLGLYIQFELPQWGHKMFGDIENGDTTDADYYWMESVKIFNTYLNSPSAVMMALGNELRPGFYYYDCFLKRLKEIEPDILYTDIAGWCAYTEHVDFSGSVPTKGESYLGRMLPTTDWDHWDNISKTPVPFLAHEVGQLQNYPDFDEAISKYYEKQTLLKPANLENFRDKQRKAGLECCFKKFSQSSGKLSAMLYRYMVEGYLRTPGAAGFQLLGLQDFMGQGTALIGILDAFLDSKGMVTPEIFRRSCSELTVLGRIPRFVWENKEQFQAEAVIANYSAGEIASAVIWSLQLQSGEIVASGKTEEITVSRGQVMSAGMIHADLSAVKDAACLQLCLRIERMPDKEEAPYAVGVNQYPVWVYPCDIQTDISHDVFITAQPDKQMEEALLNGKKVLLIVSGDKDSLPRSRKTEFEPDFWSPMFHKEENDGYGLGVAIDASHPVFREFPTEDYADWQWYDLIDKKRSILIDDAPGKLVPIVQSIPTIDVANRLAMLFEAKVEQGRLILTTMDLLESELPAAKQLLRSVLKYMGSDEFSPEVSLSLGDIRNLVPDNGETLTEKCGNDEDKADAIRQAAPADKSELFTALAEASTHREENYTSEAWGEFNKVYQQARSLGALTNASQGEIDSMVMELKDALSIL